MLHQRLDLFFTRKCSTTNKNDRTYNNDIFPRRPSTEHCVLHTSTVYVNVKGFMEQNKLLEVPSSAGCNYFKIQFSNNSSTDAFQFQLKIRIHGDLRRLFSQRYND